MAAEKAIQKSCCQRKTGPGGLQAVEQNVPDIWGDADRHKSAWQTSETLSRRARSKTLVTYGRWLKTMQSKQVQGGRCHRPGRTRRATNTILCEAGPSEPRRARSGSSASAHLPEGVRARAILSWGNEIAHCGSRKHASCASQPKEGTQFLR